jgi:hypothetical protein
MIVELTVSRNVSKSPETLPISHVHLKTFGHTRENSPEFLRELMARVVLSRVLAGGR